MQKKKKTSAPWTDPEIRILLDHFEQRGPQYCSEILQALGYARNHTSTAQKGRLVGLKYKGPKLGCFPPGHKPWQKGLKLTDEQKKKNAATWFKPGQLHGAANNNYKPVGSETIRQGGYHYVKVAEGLWREKHRLLWEQAYGPIPPRHLVAFRDGNPHNCHLGNLELITKKENWYRNRHGAGPSEYGLLSGNIAKNRLNKRGITNKTIRANPELLELAKAEILLKLKSRKQHGHHSNSTPA